MQLELCIQNCLQNKIIKNCGCYMPKFNVENNNTTISCYTVRRPDLASKIKFFFLNYI